MSKKKKNQIGPAQVTTASLVLFTAIIYAYQLTPTGQYYVGATRNEEERRRTWNSPR